MNSKSPLGGLRNKSSNRASKAWAASTAAESNSAKDSTSARQAPSSDKLPGSAATKLRTRSSSTSSCTAPTGSQSVYFAGFLLFDEVMNDPAREGDETDFPPNLSPSARERKLGERCRLN